MRSHSVFHYRNSIIWLVLLALALRSFIPQGYMPDFSAAGFPKLILCDGINHSAMHHQDMEHDSNSHNTHSDVCPFSIGALYGFDGIKIPLILPSVLAASAIAFLLPSPFVRNLDFGSAIPRSPPLFS
jgi:hypothetical protein